MPTSMSHGLAALANRRRAKLGAAIGAGAAAWMLLAAPAHATTTGTLAAAMSPNRLGAHGSLTVKVVYAGGEFGVPTPIRRAILRFPAGLSLDIPELRSCSSARLQALGANACPAQSKLGTGTALVETRPASQTIEEHVSLSAFLGPPRHLQPTIVLLGEGETPVAVRLVLDGSVLTSRAPFGEQLTLSVPPIPTLPLAPDASIVSLSLTVGVRRTGTRAVNAIVMPSRCPAGGFPFAGEFAFADGTSASAETRTPCPR